MSGKVIETLTISIHFGLLGAEATDNGSRLATAPASPFVSAPITVTPALTGYRYITGDGATIVDAAHIEAWATHQNDDIGNAAGMLLPRALLRPKINSNATSSYLFHRL